MRNFAGKSSRVCAMPPFPREQVVPPERLAFEERRRELILIRQLRALPLED